MAQEKRYTVTIDLYIYAETDSDAKVQAQNVCGILHNLSDNKASVVSIHETPFGKIGEAREVK